MNLSLSAKNNAALTRLIQQEIQDANGTLAFSRFMELALYAEDCGFYSRKSEKFGSAGDFITAPEISPLFAQCLAVACLSIFHALPHYQILEIGAGSGKLAKELLLELEKHQALPEHYFIFEISESLRIRQQQFLKTNCPHLYSRIHWLTEMPAEKISGIILANEVMDALPVYRFCIANGEALEQAVAIENDTFCWKNRKPREPLKKQIELIHSECHLPDNYQSEICLAVSAWITSLANALKEGVILLLDYGYGRQEYYHPERSQGTLTCFYQHQKNSDPFTQIGLQDITAHVDFTRVIESAMDAGLTFKGYTTQAAFLLSTGLMTLAESTPLSEIERLEQANAIKTLILPSEMGETVKVMALAKHFEAPLPGFNLLDRSRDL